METEIFTCAVLTVSDKGAAGQRRDTAGPAVAEMLADQGLTVAATGMVADDEASIRQALCRWIDEQGIDFVVTVGGTGVAPRDVTPEATRAVLHREVPGLAEAMRRASCEKTPHAMLSRGLAGIRGRSLVVNLPGSEKAARENLAVLLPALAHCLAKIKGSAADCGVGEAS